MIARSTATCILAGATAVPGAGAQRPVMAPPILASAGSTRALALGDAFMALGSDPDAIFYNPAQLVPARGIAVGLQRHERASTLLTVSAASVLAPGTVGVGVQLLDQASSEPSYRAMSGRGTSALFERGSAMATAAVASLAYARPAFFNTRVGVTGKVIHQQFGSDRDVTGAFDVGIARGSSVVLAITGRNLGHGIRLGGETVALPREIAFGAAVPRREVGPLDLAATGSISLLAGGTLVGGAGTEWAYMPLDGFTFVGRVGYRAAEYAGSQLTLGAGFVGERASLDYAFLPSTGAGAAHRVGIRWR